MSNGVDTVLLKSSKRAKMIGTISAGTAATLAFLAANVDYAPAHRGFVKLQVAEVVEEKINKQVDSKFRMIEERVARGEARQSAAQLQINTLRRDSLEKEKFDLNLRLKTVADDGTRQLIDQRLRQVNDDLGDVQNERAQIRTQQP